MVMSHHQLRVPVHRALRASQPVPANDESNKVPDDVAPVDKKTASLQRKKRKSKKRKSKKRPYQEVVRRKVSGGLPGIGRRR